MSTSSLAEHKQHQLTAATPSLTTLFSNATLSKASNVVHERKFRVLSVQQSINLQAYLKTRV